MALDGIVSSPHRRTQSSQSAFSLTTNKKQLLSKGDEFNSWTALYQRHRFLLVALALLAFLCTIYLYFAVTLGAAYDDSCLGLTGSEKALCMAKGKLKFH